MAAFVKFHCFVEDEAEKVHNLATDTLMVMLTNTAPSQSNTAKADITEITPGNGYTAGGVQAVQGSSSQTGGVYTVTAADIVITASGGPIGPFRWAILYNDTPTSPADPLIGFWDYGSSVSLGAGESFTIDFDAIDGLLQKV